jgi:hypothetical protein
LIEENCSEGQGLAVEMAYEMHDISWRRPIAATYSSHAAAAALAAATADEAEEIACVTLPKPRATPPE